jgi:hypothetical protein
MRVKKLALYSYIEYSDALTLDFLEDRYCFTQYSNDILTDCASIPRSSIFFISLAFQDLQTKYLVIPFPPGYNNYSATIRVHIV